MKKPIIITSRIVPNHVCVNLLGTFWTRDKSWIDKYVVNHERIHTRQQRELLFLPFYVLYLLEWLIRFFQYGNLQTAYLNISFEKEAYNHDYDLSYLSKRQPYSWIKFIHG